MEMTIIGILVFLIICAVICLSVGYYRYTKLAHKLAMNRNNIHFYIARDKDGEIFLYMGKPFRGIERFHACYNGCIVVCVNPCTNLSDFGLNPKDFENLKENLKFEDEPVEVFLNLE